MTRQTERKIRKRPWTKKAKFSCLQGQRCDFTVKKQKNKSTKLSTSSQMTFRSSRKKRFYTRMLGNCFIQRRVKKSMNYDIPITSRDTVHHRFLLVFFIIIIIKKKHFAFWTFDSWAPFQDGIEAQL